MCGGASKEQIPRSPSHTLRLSQNDKSEDGIQPSRIKDQNAIDNRQLKIAN